MNPLRLTLVLLNGFLAVLFPVLLSGLINEISVAIYLGYFTSAWPFLVGIGLCLWRSVSSRSVAIFTAVQLALISTANFWLFAPREEVIDPFALTYVYYGKPMIDVSMFFIGLIVSALIMPSRPNDLSKG